jgi:hypothetical protein
MQRNLKNDIIETAENFTDNFSDKAKFDFSVESLQDVDAMLDELRDFEIDEDYLNSACSMVGSYIFEVARRNFGGEYYWVQDKEQPVLITGEPAFSVLIYAFDKVRGRIVNGEEDNILYYFEGYVKAVQKGKETGYCATIV